MLSQYLLGLVSPDLLGIPWFALIASSEHKGGHRVLGILPGVLVVRHGIGNLILDEFLLGFADLLLCFGDQFSFATSRNSFAERSLGECAGDTHERVDGR